MIELALSSTSTVKEAIEKIFGENSVMVEVAKCESGLRQYDSDGNVLKGKIDHDDTGLFQINTEYHLKDAVDKSIDIYTIYGNIEYARLLYSEYGTNPWKASSGCWQT